MTSQNLPRRRFLAGSATAAAAAAVGTQAVAHAQSSSSSSALSSARLPKAPAPKPWSVFMHGVASGDPLPDSVIIWTRVSVSPEAAPGSEKGEDADVTWEIATDDAFANIVRSGSARTTAVTDHTVKVDPRGLQPGTEYFYRFRYKDTISPVGKTRTAPASNADINEYKLVVASCANYECGYFTAYRDMAERAEAGGVDVVVFLGDYIYEYPTGEYAGKSGVSRPHHPAHEIVTLADYRIRYGRYRTDEHLQRAHAAAPWVVVWDDHETANDSWVGGAENHTPGEEGEWKVRESAAHQAYFEWLPVRATRPSQDGHIYRSYRFGNLLQLTMMDLRSYRDEQAKTFSKKIDAPERTMLGSEQFNWLKGQVESADTTWNVLGNSVMISRMEIGHLPNTTEQNRTANYAIDEFTQSAGLAVNTDQWDGYRAERAKLFNILTNTKAHTLFLTGDIHSEWAHSVQHNGLEIGAEMVCSSITAPNVDEIVTQYTRTYTPEDNPVTHLVEQVMYSANPWVNHVDFDSHGYGIARVQKDRVIMDFYRVSNVEDPGASARLAVSRTWVPGQGFQQ
ncbi:alkaline phosphatase D family protein [Corynebacterium sp. CCUG 71335]|uniref:alkaline phosphatase D family protein n=1 Tax=unclassified Corynebacterium TaxID=2624378 RepID=UPI00210944B8|nr:MULTISPECIES: alkaline phosphatase D family protein [unclassified Corynebacterium]MCQ4618434.1 alkaline phosphatase D family protein [Corynebacterium pseudogenitalium]MCQ4621055.1 alkaline phosphatase D family protein [Corynebacterium sp. CCUG 71335]MCQ4623206.1 alkaline phosphatase D family protein [Corynebacterium sp. CCUG 70398]